jgi:(2Fe-2S) ferredoxin
VVSFTPLPLYPEEAVWAQKIGLEDVEKILDPHRDSNSSVIEPVASRYTD